MITDNDHERVGAIIDECTDGELCDVILCGTVEFDEIENIRIRYLNFINFD